MVAPAPSHDTDKAIALLIKAKADIAAGITLPALSYINLAIDLIKVTDWDAVEADLAQMGHDKPAGCGDE